MNSVIVDGSIYNSTNKYLNEICFSGANSRLMKFPLEEKEINGVVYYKDQYYNIFLTKEVMEAVKDSCHKTYSLYECDLIRTQKHSNTRTTGQLESVESVIDYMLNSSNSWLPRILIEIDDDINKLNLDITKAYSDMAYFKTKEELVVDINYLTGLINKLEIEIFNLKSIKDKMVDVDYLKSKIRVEYRINKNTSNIEVEG